MYKVQKERGGEMSLREDEGFGMLDLVAISLAKPTYCILFPHKGRGVS
jgi:hypothetical protein